jgi:hypothetical protein
MTKKHTKEEADYTPHATKHDERCELCKSFRPLYGKCKKVAGEIVPKGWCRLFTRKN